MTRIVTAAQRINAGAVVRTETYETRDDGSIVPAGAADVANPYDCAFGPGSVFPVIFEDGEWTIDIHDTRSPKSFDADTPVPDADPV